MSAVENRSADWWEDLYANTADTAGLADTETDADADMGDTEVVEKVEGSEGAGGGRWFRRSPGYWPRPSLPQLSERSAVSPGTRRLAYNSAAAGAGWALGLEPQLGGWIAECGREASIGAALFLGGGMCLLLAVVWDSRTRHWMPGLAWVARIPLASAVTALALYAPASQL